MFIVYILMIISRFLGQAGQGPSWLGAEFVRGRDVQLPSGLTARLVNQGSQV